MNDKLEAIYNYRRLSGSIATAGQPSEAQLRDVAQAGFEVVINLSWTDSDGSLENEEPLLESLGVVYEPIPVMWERPTEKDLDRFFETMTAHDGKKLFIPCAANMRVSVFMALFRILKEDWPRADALEEISHVWEPNAIWKSFIKTVLKGSL